MTVIKCYHGDGQHVQISVNGEIQSVRHEQSYSFTVVDLPEGACEIVITKRSILNQWYWWMTMFNVVKAVSEIRGIAGHPLGYDSDFVLYRFSAEIKDAQTAELAFALRKNYYDEPDCSGVAFQIEPREMTDAQVLSVERLSLPPRYKLRYRIAQGLPLGFLLSLVLAFMIAGAVSGKIDLNWEYWLLLLFVSVWMIGGWLFALFKRSEADVLGARSTKTRTAHRSKKRK